MRRTSILALVGLIAGVTAPFAAAQKINAAGASFPDPIYEKWFADYHKAHPEVQISYNPNGSGGGVKGITDGTIDFGASDPPMSDTEIAALKGKVYHFPTVLGAVVPIYNVPGITQDLKFSGQTLADIYMAKITKWNDKAIAAENPGVKLPNEDIVPVHRTDNSGTTYVFTDFLAKVSPEWKQKIGFAKGVSWPVGLGGAQNAGVAGQVKNTPFSIGYAELIYAVHEKIGYGSVKNAAGEYIKADIASVTAAAASVKEIPADFRVSITNAPGSKVYPISSYTYMLIPEKFADAAKGKVVKAFLAWMLTDGQKSAPGLDYAPLPTSVVEKEKKQLAMLK
ncbi:MAG TPA: phosphate ABC transporter substrate-binding protein PstS [Bryobacteraceae bacterium]|nr:phosphate ABC transporter substrate-binding protein PstS [Bryobacteraceae bacterium]